MPLRHRLFALILLSLLLVASCGSVQPTVTLLPVTATQAAVVAADSPLPPTAAPALPTVPAVATKAEPRAAPTEVSPAPSAVATTGAGSFSRDQTIEDVQQLDREIERVFRESDCPGLAVGVIKDQELIYAKGFGVTNLETGGEVTPRTLFHMASVTKPFVATAIMQLLEQEKLSLDDSIVKHLPYFEMLDRRHTMLTIRQFLTHSSGMPDVDDYHWDEPEYDEGALERLVRSLSDGMLVSVPGGQFNYSNLAFDVLGDLIAKVSGQSFADYVKEHILLPLGMNDSSILIRDVDPALLANGHIQEEGGTISVSEHYAYNRRHGPSSCLYSNVVDMSQWAIANMNRGELEGRRILDESSYELLWAPAVVVGVREGTPRHVGLSWFLSEYAGYETVSHGGRDIGYQTDFVMVPDEGVAVIVLSNLFGPESIVNEVTEMALELALGSE
jgi:CubicO group peptidase (beta-lactamase class C family)